ELRGRERSVSHDRAHQIESRADGRAAPRLHDPARIKTRLAQIAVAMEHVRQLRFARAGEILGGVERHVGIDRHVERRIDQIRLPRLGTRERVGVEPEIDEHAVEGAEALGAQYVVQVRKAPAMKAHALTLIFQSLASDLERHGILVQADHASLRTERLEQRECVSAGAGGRVTIDAVQPMKEPLNDLLHQDGNGIGRQDATNPPWYTRDRPDASLLISPEEVIWAGSHPSTFLCPSLDGPADLTNTNEAHIDARSSGRGD